MLTAKQISWAAQHDWFVKDNGDGTITVLDRWHDIHGDHDDLVIWRTSFSALRDWAGY